MLELINLRGRQPWKACFLCFLIITVAVATCAVYYHALHLPERSASRDAKPAADACRM
jgi:hypothetical protein